MTTTKTYTDSEIEALWSQGNDAGRGYAVGSDSDSPWEAAEAEDMTDIRTFDTRTSLAYCVVAMDGDDLIAICDCHGPWAVNISQEVE